MHLRKHNSIVVRVTCKQNLQIDEECMVVVTETMHRLLDQCEADQSLHAEQQGLTEVPCVAIGRIDSL